MRKYRLFSQTRLAYWAVESRTLKQILRFARHLGDVVEIFEDDSPIGTWSPNEGVYLYGG